MPSKTTMRTINDLERAKELVKALSADQLNELRAFITLRLSAPVGKPKSVHDEDATDVTRFISMVCEVCKARNIDFTTPQMLMQSSQYRSCKAKLQSGILKFIDDAATHNRVMSRALTRLALELLCDNLLAMNKITNARAMLTHIHRIPSILDRSFPGYARHGMLSLILKTEEGDNVRTRIPRKKSNG